MALSSGSNYHGRCGNTIWGGSICIEKKKYASKYEINMLRCIFCGLCEEGMPERCNLHDRSHSACWHQPRNSLFLAKTNWWKVSPLTNVWISQNVKVLLGLNISHINLNSHPSFSIVTFVSIVFSISLSIMNLFLIVSHFHFVFCNYGDLYAQSHVQRFFYDPCDAWSGYALFIIGSHFFLLLSKSLSIPVQL